MLWFYTSHKVITLDSSSKVTCTFTLSTVPPSQQCSCNEGEICQITNFFVCKRNINIDLWHRFVCAKKKGNIFFLKSVLWPSSRNGMCASVTVDQFLRIFKIEKGRIDFCLDWFRGMVCAVRRGTKSVFFKKKQSKTWHVKVQNGLSLTAGDYSFQ